MIPAARELANSRARFAHTAHTALSEGNCETVQYHLPNLPAYHERATLDRLDVLAWSLQTMVTQALNDAFALVPPNREVAA